MVKEKYVRIFCDYCADPFWHKHGGMMGYEQLPISDLLKLAFRAWDHAFQLDNKYLYYGSKDYGGTALEYFCETGELLAKQVKKELPDWTVVYLNYFKKKEQDNKPEYQATTLRSFWEYEIKGE